MRKSEEASAPNFEFQLQLDIEPFENAVANQIDEPEEDAEGDVPDWLSVMADGPAPDLDQPTTQEPSTPPEISSMETIVSRRPPELRDFQEEDLPASDMRIESTQTEELATPEPTTSPMVSSEAVPDEQVEVKAEPTTAPSDPLDAARSALDAGNLKEAIERYGELVSKRSQLELVIEDLQGTLEENPNIPGLWQVLGDAYMNADQVMQAINAYRRGVESI